MYVYLLIEFQNTVDPWMAVRIMVCTGLLYQNLIKSGQVATGNRLLPPVFPIVLYNGMGRWTASQEVADLIEPISLGLRRYRPSQRYFLLEEANVPREELEAREGLSTLLIRLEQAQDILIKTLKMKFASVPSQVISRIRAIHTKETADKLFEQAFTCVSLEEFEKEIEAVTDN